MGPSRLWVPLVHYSYGSVKFNMPIVKPKGKRHFTNPVHGLHAWLSRFTLVAPHA